MVTMKIKEIISYSIGFLVGILLTCQVLIDFKVDNLVCWSYLIPIVGYNIMLVAHLIDRIKHKKGD